MFVSSAAGLQKKKTIKMLRERAFYWELPLSMHETTMLIWLVLIKLIILFLIVLLTKFANFSVFN